MISKVHKYYNVGIRLIIALVAFSYLARQLFRNHDLHLVKSSLAALFQPGRIIPGLIFVTFLMLVNWGLEAVKWKILISRIEKVSWMKAFIAVLSGVTVSFFTPNRVGEFLGRIFILEKADRLESSLITIVGSLSQLIITLLMGTIGLLLFLDRYTSLFINLTPLYTTGIILACLLCFCFMLALFFNVSLLANLEHKVQDPAGGSRLRKSLGVLKQVTPKDLLPVLLLSLLRYIVFTVQACMLLKVSDIDISWYDSVIITTLVFLLITIVPTIALAELGVRGSVAVFLFGFYERTMTGGTNGNTDIQVIITFTLLWVINIALPAVLGSFGLSRLRFFRNNPE